MRILIFLIFLFQAILLFAQPSAEKKPFVLGLIDEIQSKKLSGKRTINIYLPEGYNEQDSLKYSVIYLLDGSADEDFIYVVGIVQFNNFSWINRVPKSIVVGIANVDRQRDFTFPTSINYQGAHNIDQMSFFYEQIYPVVLILKDPNRSP